MPSLRALEILVAVADEGSITAAGQRLFLTQPAVSHQLKALESELGAALIDRSASGAALTPEGRAVLPHAREAIAAAGRAALALQEQVDPIVRIACAESFTVPLLSPAIRAWTHRNESARLELIETTSSEEVLDAVRSDRADLGITPLQGGAGGLFVTELAAEEVVVTGAAEHDVLQQPVTLRRVARERLVGVDAQNGFSAWLTDQFAAAKSVQHNEIRVRSLTTAAALADAGVGLAVVPMSALAPEAPWVSLRPPLMRDVAAVTRSEPAGIVGRFVEILANANPPNDIQNR